MSNNSIKTSLVLLTAAALLAAITRKSKQSNKKKVAGQKQELKPPQAPEDGYCKERPKETNGFVLQQTMLRIKDPKVSLDFYSRVLGMRLIRSFHFPEAKFSLYFMGYIDETAMPKDDQERKAWLFQQPATLELTHNHGTENQPDFKYNNGNVEPHRGYGHIGIDVPDLFKASLISESHFVLYLLLSFVTNTFFLKT